MDQTKDDLSDSGIGTTPRLKDIEANKDTIVEMKGKQKSFILDGCKKRYRDRKSGIVLWDFQPSKPKTVNRGALFRWSVGPLSAWGSIESNTVLTKHPSLRVNSRLYLVLALHGN